MSDRDTAYIYEISGDVKGIAGKIKADIINQYIIAEKSKAEIHSQRLIKGSPYLGLNKFEPEDKDKFFGREQRISELSKELDKNNLLLLPGASGSGKSSLIQAGIIPYLSDEWGVSKLVKLIFVPDKNPFESLYNSLPNKYKNRVTEIINQQNKEFLITLINKLKENSNQWVIFIDQFEELFTSTSELKCSEFIAALVSLIEQKDCSVKLIMALRTDFLDNLRKYVDLIDKVESKIRFIKDMTEIELRFAIAEPAARNGVTFEKGLVEKIISDFYKQAGSLPLLQYTLDLLWEKNNISDDNRVLLIKTYNDLGGVAGALQQQANYLYNEILNDEEKKAAKEIFFDLIDLKLKEPTSRRVEKSQFSNDPVKESALNKLIESRLLVSGREKTNTVEVAHEKLLKSWDFTQKLIQEQEEIIILKSRLISDAQQWNELKKENEEKSKDELWSGYKLEQVLEYINQKAFGTLDKNGEQFIKTSVDKRNFQAKEKEKQNKRLANAFKITLTASIGLLISMIFAGRQSYELAKSEIEAVRQSSQAFLTSFSSNINLDALIESIRAAKMLNRRLSVDENIRLSIKNNLNQALNFVRELNRLEEHSDQVWSVSFSPDNKHIATASSDNTVKLWTQEGKMLQTLEDPNLNGQTHDNWVKSVSFSPDNQLIVTASEEDIKSGTVKLWSRNGEFKRTLKIEAEDGSNDGVKSISFSPDSQLIAAASYNGTVKMWNRDGNPHQTLKYSNNLGRVLSASFNSNGQILAAAGDDQTVKLWKKEEDGQYKYFSTLKGHEDGVISVSFSPENNFIASSSNDGIVKLWKKEEDGQYKYFSTLKGHEDGVTSVSFSPNGQTLATASDDSTVKLWKKHDGQYKYFSTLSGHERGVLSASFSPNGQTLATASDVIQPLNSGVWIVSIPVFIVCTRIMKFGVSVLAPMVRCSPQVVKTQLLNSGTERVK